MKLRGLGTRRRQTSSSSVPARRMLCIREPWAGEQIAPGGAAMGLRSSVSLVKQRGPRAPRCPSIGDCATGVMDVAPGMNSAPGENSAPGMTSAPGGALFAGCDGGSPAVTSPRSTASSRTQVATCQALP
eukprot:CAMPEP_0180676108 /NCGR_PEP_ID=MMETSP1037_2-20121125/67123_1 /TAXON_ID=632150 /ORGANISM="Azadinium spinosum, Strain 3D9" /LENGTH=129 /DNA_ID=CAMNT_0022705563 /DNA_START=274 /DNA_END=660 /DNA_ORIENTATION=+